MPGKGWLRTTASAPLPSAGDPAVAGVAASSVTPGPRSPQRPCPPPSPRDVGPRSGGETGEARGLTPSGSVSGEDPKPEDDESRGAPEDVGRPAVRAPASQSHGDRCDPSVASKEEGTNRLAGEITTMTEAQTALEPEGLSRASPGVARRHQMACRGDAPKSRPGSFESSRAAAGASAPGDSKEPPGGGGAGRSALQT